MTVALHEGPACSLTRGRPTRDGRGVGPEPGLDRGAARARYPAPRPDTATRTSAIVAPRTDTEHGLEATVEGTGKADQCLSTAAELSFDTGALEPPHTTLGTRYHLEQRPRNRATSPSARGTGSSRPTATKPSRYHQPTRSVAQLTGEDEHESPRCVRRRIGVVHTSGCLTVRGYRCAAAGRTRRLTSLTRSARTRRSTKRHCPHGRSKRLRAPYTQFITHPTGDDPCMGQDHLSRW